MKIRKKIKDITEINKGKKVILERDTNESEKEE